MSRPIAILPMVTIYALLLLPAGAIAQQSSPLPDMDLVNNGLFLRSQNEYGGLLIGPNNGHSLRLRRVRWNEMKSLSLSLQVGVVLGHDKADASQLQFGQSVPFELQSGFLISIKGGIGELNGLRFILDTGTTVSVVDRRVAMKFPISLRSDHLFAFQKFMVLDRAEFPEVRFGPVKAENVSLLVADLAKTSEFAAHADAVIGLDLLCLSKTLRVDYNTATVSFIGSKTAPSTVDLRQHPKCLIAELIVQGHPVRLIVDTGMEGVLFYENRLRKRVPDLRLQGKPQNGHLGWMRAKSTILPGLQLNNTVSETPVWLADEPKENVLPGIDGVIGTASLKARQIEFDFEKNVLRWQ